jgi:hypothetical protein
MYLRQFKLKWRGLQSLVLIQSQREIDHTIQTEQRLIFICACPARLIFEYFVNLYSKSGRSSAIRETNQGLHKVSSRQSIKNRRNVNFPLPTLCSRT